ncbi:RHS repeat-associated core domain-containing protein [uncultured Psychromonas sp.]|uniref:RHS repeat-associated core domain-containing protein n=1 Tax=uncultured Psychromonas sp. TaxID=173974 RepID=UPI00260D55F2|nr:RHS repeat-associated core domain-containing protein [uncultured Psychromonas sp.]
MFNFNKQDLPFSSNYWGGFIVKILFLSFIFPCAVVFFISSANAVNYAPSGSAQFELSGDLMVEGGKAVYELPIEITPGRAGHIPNISLLYNSDNNNGYLGMGWQLQANSVITHCGQNLEKDGVWGGVNFDAEDRYCLDGQRLIAITGYDGADSTEYRVEKNGYSKIVSYGNSGSGPSYFKIWLKTGNVLEYGVTSDAKVELPTTKNIYKWALNKSTDISGNNHIFYHYDESFNNITVGKTHRLTLITYEGGEIKFNYETRVDKVTQYLAGQKLARNKRIKSIVTRDQNNELVKNYNIKYIYSDATNRSLINAIDLCVADGCSSKISFDWNTKKVGTFINEEKSFFEPHFIDRNGDGFFSTYGIIKRQLIPGKAIMSLIAPSRSRETTTNSYALSGAMNNPSYKIFKSGCQAKYYRKHNDGILTAVCDSHVYADFNGNGKETATSDSNTVVDFNNDGRADILTIKNGQINLKLAGSNDLIVSPKINKDLDFVDINNDGYLDVITNNPLAKVIYLFNGKQFVKHQSFAFKNMNASKKINSYFADMNNDGYPELYYNGQFYLNKFGTINGSKAWSDLNYSVGKTGVMQFLDINSDGWLDIIRSFNGKTVLRKSIASVQDKIITISEYGKHYSINYKSLFDRSVHKQIKYYQFPFVNSTPSKYVVANVVKTPRGYSDIAYDYQYIGAKSHLKGGGFLGFSSIVETEKAEMTTVTTREFEQLDLAKIGELSKVSVRRNNKLISRQNINYRVLRKKGVNANYYQVYPNKVDTEVFGLNGAVEKKITKQILMDIFGNEIENTMTIVGGKSDAPYIKKTINTFESKGENRYHQILKLSPESIINFATIPQSEAGIEKFCSDSGNIYLKAKDKIHFIPGIIDIPITVKRYPQYYQFKKISSNNALSENTIISGDLQKSNLNDVQNDNIYSCGNFNLQNDSSKQLKSTQNSFKTQELITESPNDFWKLGALKSNTVTINSGEGNITFKNTMKYLKNGLLSSVYNHGGSYGGSNGKYAKNNYGYDEYGNITSETISGTGLTPRTISTLYDGSSVTPRASINALGHKTLLEYEQRNGQLAKRVSPSGKKVSTWKYDKFDRIIEESKHGFGNTIRYTYKLGANCSNAHKQTVSCIIAKSASQGDMVTQFDYEGKEIRNAHQGFNGRWIYQDTQWDRNGRKLSTTRPSFKKNSSEATVYFEYDERNREIKKTEPAANGGSATYTTNYDRLKTVITDARGYKHTTIKNVLGYILTKIEPHGASQTYSYYPDGKLKTSTDSSNNKTQIKYDNLGHRSQLIDPDMGNWTYKYSAAGELLYKKDANGKVTNVVYDKLGRKIAQNEDKQTSHWSYDKSIPGTLSSHSGHGNLTRYTYGKFELVNKVSMTSSSETLSTEYQYDNYGRLRSELRPNGNSDDDKLNLQYTYNSMGYMTRVRSPKTAADNTFSSAKYRNSIKQLMDDALIVAKEYVGKATYYKNEENFLKNKAKEYNVDKIEVHRLDEIGQQLLANNEQYQKWCSDDGVCYLRPSVWLSLHGPITVPVKMLVGNEVYRLETQYNSSTPDKRLYDAEIDVVSLDIFNNANLTKADDTLFIDSDNNGQKELISNNQLFAAKADKATRTSLLSLAAEVNNATAIANERYKYYADLAEQITSLLIEISKVSGLYCDQADRLVGDELNSSEQEKCTNKNENSQWQHLENLLNESKNAEKNNAAYITYWQRQDTDAYDHTLSETLGNGLVNTYQHNQKTGRPDYIATHKGSQVFDQRIKQTTNKGSNIRLLQYRYDNHNNVTYRYDSELGIQDTFYYDGLDRLINNKIVLDSPNLHGISNPDFNVNNKISYDKLGNITNKSNVGAYQYRGTAPHAVSNANNLDYHYDKVGNLLSATKEKQGTESIADIERELEWSDFNKPLKITRNDNTVEFKYDANHDRYYKKSVAEGETIETLYFKKLYERNTNLTNGEVEHKHFIYADGKLIALNTQVRDKANKLKDKQVRYLHYDALGSVDLITDGYGAVVERRSFDPWGKKRSIRWDEKGALDLRLVTNRGFTGHEHIEEVGLIHMNGRIYDQTLGRFMSADPEIQAPFMTNSFNRYSYVMNNPLKYTDPTGFSWESFSNAVSNAWSSFKNSFGGSSTSTSNNTGSKNNRANGTGDANSNLGASDQTDSASITDDLTGYSKAFFNDFLKSILGDDPYGKYINEKYGIPTPTEYPGLSIAPGEERGAAVFKADPWYTSSIVTVFIGRKPPKPSELLDFGNGVIKGRISVYDALDKAADFMKDGVPIRSIDGKTGVQFIQEFTENGQKITKRVGFDLNPNSSHVKQLGPHLNLQTQINGKIKKKGALADPHISIDPKTIRPGDY